jgi:hypothetical protein
MIDIDSRGVLRRRDCGVVHLPRDAMIVGEKRLYIRLHMYHQMLEHTIHYSSALPLRPKPLHDHHLPVEGFRCSDIHQHEAINLPILQSNLDDSPRQPAFGRETLFTLQSVVHHFLLQGCKETGLVGPVVYHPERRNGYEQGKDTFPDELGSVRERV